MRLDEINEVYQAGERKTAGNKELSQKNEDFRDNAYAEFLMARYSCGKDQVPHYLSTRLAYLAPEVSASSSQLSLDVTVWKEWIDSLPEPLPPQRAWWREFWDWFTGRY